MTKLFPDRRPNLASLLVVLQILFLQPGLGQHDLLAAESAKVLYVTQSAGFAHPVLPHSEAVLKRIATETGIFDIAVTRDAETINSHGLENYDAVVFFTTGELPLDQTQQEALLAYVRRGGGFVGVHSATDTFYEWPQYLSLIGGYFDGHPWHQQVTVSVEDETHPSTRHLGTSFEIYDEIYQHRNWSRDRVHVLLSLDVTSVDMTARGIKRQDGDFALAWTRQEGAGRVFYTALGHRPEVWDDTRFQQHLLEGILWAMGSKSNAMTLAAHNTLSPEEIADGWTLLFDGEDLSSWRGYGQQNRPDGWQAVDGTLARTGQAGDLVTVERFTDFELQFEWRVEEAGNSGVMFRVTEGDGPPWYTGPEFQVLHNAGHQDGRDPITSAGSNYAVHPPLRDVTLPAGSWNQARLVVRGPRVEHWMNGVKLLDYEIGSPDWTRRVAASKFADLPRYGREPSGHIAIQDHGDPVAFRNIKLRRH